MSGEEVCKHNQSGYCKYKLNCEKRHENELCPEKLNCNSEECPLRHPSANIFSGSEFAGLEMAALTHTRKSQIKIKKKDMIEKHEKEINAIKDEMNKLKEIISLIKNKVAEINLDILSSKKVNIEEIVGLVVSLLDNPKSFEKSYIAANKNESLMQCDICDFKSENEKQMESHMGEEHDDCYCCYMCAKYFKTKQSFRYHNKFIHNEHHNLTESEESALWVIMSVRPFTFEVH